MDPFAALSHLNAMEEDCNLEHGAEYKDSLESQLRFVSVDVEVQERCTLGQDVSKAIGETELFITRENLRKRRHTQPWLNDHPYSNIKRNQYLSQDDVDFIKRYLGHKFTSIDDTLDKHKWIKLDINEVNPEDSKLLCGDCSKYRLEMKIRPQDSDSIALDGITLHTEKAINENKLKTHNDGAQHLRTTQFLLKKSLKEIEEDDYLMESRKDSRDCSSENPYIITQRMILTVYTEIQLNIAFVRHHELINMQILNGLNMVRLLYLKKFQR